MLATKAFFCETLHFSATSQRVAYVAVAGVSPRVLMLQVASRSSLLSYFACVMYAGVRHKILRL